MATTESLLVVCDAGPLIHLDELGCLDLLRGLGDVLVPDEVLAESRRHRPQISLGDVRNVQVVQAVNDPPSARLATMIDSFGLDAGEIAALAIMERVSARLLLCDDAAARLAAESMGYAVRGTIGVLVRSIRVAARTRQEVVDLLQQLPERSSLHISRQLLEMVLGEVRDILP